MYREVLGTCNLKTFSFSSSLGNEEYIVDNKPATYLTQSANIPNFRHKGGVFLSILKLYYDDKC